MEHNRTNLNYDRAGVPMTLEEYQKVHNDRFQPNKSYSFVEWACRRVTALTELDCALRTEQFIRMRDSHDLDFDSFRNNTYHEKLLPVAVATYNKVKPRGGANAGDPDEVFRSFIVCHKRTCKGLP